MSEQAHQPISAGTWVKVVNEGASTSGVVLIPSTDAVTPAGTSVRVEGVTSTGSTLPRPLPNHPLAEVVGSFANNPFWDAVMTEIEARRRPWWKFWGRR